MTPTWTLNMVEQEQSNLEHLHSQKEANEWPAFEVGRSIILRLRRAVNEAESYFAPEEGEDLFQTLYLSQRDGCIPDEHLGEDLMDDIINLYYPVLAAVREELCERLKIPYDIRIYVEPSYLGETLWLMTTDEKVLLRGGSKAWWFWWESEEAMAEELETWYQDAASRLVENRALLGDRTRWAVREVLYDLHLSFLLPDQCPEHNKEAGAADEHRDGHLKRAIARLEALLGGKAMPEEVGADEQNNHGTPSDNGTLSSKGKEIADERKKSQL